jgi:3-hydroxyisobutyrate dehydrogenase-like beta-hydroxyacid dehydrogenase
MIGQHARQKGATEMVERVGIVGMGLMGQAFIQNMRKSQFIVQGYDVDPARIEDLKREGGHPAG